MFIFLIQRIVKLLYAYARPSTCQILDKSVLFCSPVNKVSTPLVDATNYQLFTTPWKVRNTSMSTSHYWRIYPPGPPCFSFFLSLELNIKSEFYQVVQVHSNNSESNIYRQLWFFSGISECQYCLSTWKVFSEEPLCTVCYYSSCEGTLKDHITQLFYIYIDQ